MSQPSDHNVANHGTAMLTIKSPVAEDEVTLNEK